jgi:hypothetical protein
MPYKSDEFRSVQNNQFAVTNIYLYVRTGTNIKMYVFIHLPITHKLLVNVSLATSFGSNT